MARTEIGSTVTKRLISQGWAFIEGGVDRTGISYYDKQNCLWERWKELSIQKIGCWKK